MSDLFSAQRPRGLESVVEQAGERSDSRWPPG